MKVKDVIAVLQQLDQERDIWVIYDSYECFAPIPDEVQGGGKTGLHIEGGYTSRMVKDGDYLINT